MTKKQFWQSASNWGLIGGAAMFVLCLAGRALDIDLIYSGGRHELMLLVVLLPLILYTGSRNAAMAGAEGYPYGRAVGYVFAVMLFTGIAYGVGQHLLINVIAGDYYDILLTNKVDEALAIYQDTSLYDMILDGRDSAVRMMKNPIYLVFGSIVEMAIKGGLLGLLLAAFFKKDPVIFVN